MCVTVLLTQNLFDLRLAHTAARDARSVWMMCFVMMQADTTAASLAAAEGRCCSAVHAAARDPSLTCPISSLSLPFSRRGPLAMIPIRTCQHVQELLPLGLSCRDVEGRSG